MYLRYMRGVVIHVFFPCNISCVIRKYSLYLWRSRLGDSMFGLDASLFSQVSRHVVGYGHLIPFHSSEIEIFIPHMFRLPPHHFYKKFRHAVCSGFLKTFDNTTVG